MNTRQAKQIMGHKAAFQTTCKNVINRNKYVMGIHKSNKEENEERLYELTQQLKTYSKEELDTEDKEALKRCYVNGGLKIDHCNSQIKKNKLTILLISHAHNLNVEKTEEYLNKYKELCHLLMEEMMTTMKRDPEFKCIFSDKNLHTKGEMSYKTASDVIMEEVKTLETFIGYVRDFAIANEVIRATNNMVKRNNK